MKWEIRGNKSRIVDGCGMFFEYKGKPYAYMKDDEDGNIVAWDFVENEVDCFKYDTQVIPLEIESIVFKQKEC